MEFVKKSLSQWITALVMLVVGILCIIAGAQSGGATGADAYKGISVFLGIVFIIIGSIGVLFGLAAAMILKKGLATAALSSGILLASGIFLLVNQDVAGTLIWTFILLVPYILIVIGAILACNAAMMLLFAIKNKNVGKSLTAVILGVVLAALSIIIGCLGVGNDPVIAHNVQFIIFGIALIVFAAFLVFATFISIPTVVAVVNIDNDEK